MWQEFFKRLVEMAFRHPGKTLGAGLGLFVGLLVVFFGVLRALFLIACIIGGLYVGALIDGDGEARPLVLRVKRTGRSGR